ITDTKQTDNTKINTLTTANGETAKVVLPDGTKVWLNAASSISYPSSFAAAPRREVSLVGEAYFEAAHDNKHPFVVSSANQTVTVLGTQFDISAYHDDNTIKTTLLEGTVQVKTSPNQNSKNNPNAGTLNKSQENSLTLSPGQQSTLTKAGTLMTKEVKPELFIDWKEGYFAFDKEPLGSIMKRVGRWYDVEFIFDDPTIKDERFYGTLSRFDNLNKMLNAISKGSEVNFKIEGKIIRVSR
ncbi:FecR family protein, partial [Pedobacter aquatilis]|uniref:FecR family protein n=1 Tax=Pedobacter aquatilis TaxID=351343 RepID=UPI00292E3D93